MIAAVVLLLLPVAWLGWLVVEAGRGPLDEPTEMDMAQLFVMVWMSGVGAGILAMGAL